MKPQQLSCVIRVGKLKDDSEPGTERAVVVGLYSDRDQADRIANIQVDDTLWVDSRVFVVPGLVDTAPELL